MTNRELTRDDIQEWRVKFEAVLGSVIPRLRQINPPPAIASVITELETINSRLAQGIGIGLRADALIEDLRSLLIAAKELLEIVGRETKLDIHSEMYSFQNLENELSSQFHFPSPAPSAWLGDRQPSNRDVDGEFLQSLDHQINKAQLAARDANIGLKSLSERFDQELAPLQDKYNKAIAAFDLVEPELNKRAAKLDELIRLQGQKVLAGRYEVDADNEEKSANWFRYGALAVMASVIVLIGFSYYELAEFTLNPSQAGIRIAFSLILSVPAAYLARESAKHRQRQYVLRQTALEIGAIDSYIQTLPIESQHKIKEETAIKLFTPQKLDGFDKDSYPLNMQELFGKLIDAVAEAKKDVKAKKDAKKDGD